jgi:UDPglucose 6-dehydrogenase
VTLQAAGASVVASDPEGENSARLLLPGVIFPNSAYACLQGADALAVLTEWHEFHALDPARNKATLAKPIVVDLRDIYPTRP